MVNNKIQAAEENLIHVYNRFPIVLDHGKGMYLYDTDGKEYLDFAAGIAVCGLGYGNEELNEALKAQIDKLCHTSNLYYHESCGEAAKELNRVSGMDRVFFTNSGTEANEGALKAARRYAFTKKTGRYEFIAMEDSFHGRSFGAVSVTGHDSYREPFEPVLPGVKFAKFNDLDSVKALVSDKTCAIILEPLQGEGGIVAGIFQADYPVRVIPEIQGDLGLCNADHGAGENISLIDLLKRRLQLFGVIRHSLLGLTGGLFRFFGDVLRSRFHYFCLFHT